MDENIHEDGIEARYFVAAAAKALEVLESFDRLEEELTIGEVARRVGIPYSSALRLLYTLGKRGYVFRRPGSKKYMRTPEHRRYRIGYAALGDSLKFSQEITWNMTVAARAAGVTLIVKDNQLNPQKALANVDILLQEKIDLLIEYQLNETAAHLISAKCENAKVPIIAISFPHPGAYYFGSNKYLTAQLAGKFLCEYAQAHWRGKVDKVLFLPVTGLTSTLEVRKAAIWDTLSKGLKSLRQRDFITAPLGLTALDGYRETKKILEEIGGKSRRVCIFAVSDGLTIGAVKAVVKMGLADRVAIVGFGGGRDARAHVQSGGPLKAQVAYFPETYGERIIPKALKILAGEKVPLTSHTHHVVLTQDNIEQYYPSRRST
jgi:ribose transport system substrate-binding protein